VKLTDFGIGQVISAEYLQGVTQAGFTQTMLGSSSSGTGTTMYLAPELIAGTPATTRSDIYSLGVVLYQLLVGDFRRPLTADWVKQIADPLLREDLGRCLAGDPEERFAGAAQLADNLRTYPARQAELVERERWRRQAAQRRRLAYVGAGVSALLLLVAAALSYGLLQARRERDQARLSAYAVDMQSAAEALGEQDLGRATAALERQVPRPGQRDLRGWEWRYFWQKCQGDPATVLRHDGPVFWADVSADGQWVASSSQGKVWIWSTQSKQRVRDLGPIVGGDTEQRLVFSPVGRLLATARANEVVVWETGTWQKLFAVPATNAFVAISGDGSTLATYGDGGPQLWSAVTGKPQVQPGQLAMPTRGSDEGSQQALALNEDGSLLVASFGTVLDFSQMRSEMVLFDLSRRTRRVLLTGGALPVALAISRDGHEFNEPDTTFSTYANEAGEHGGARADNSHVCLVWSDNRNASQATRYPARKQGGIRLVRLPWPSP
jgi:hypothetical protein